MPARIIDGSALASALREQLVSRVARLRDRGVKVRLDAVLVDRGDNSARVYADNQRKTCEHMGIEYRLHRLGGPEIAVGYDDVAGRVLLLSAQDDVHAIMVHLPLPEGVDPYAIQRLIAPEKDVEGVNPANIGNIVYGRSSLAPCTGLAVLKMLQWVVTQELGPLPPHPVGQGMLRGKLAVVVGAGDVVGKPIAVLLMRHEATVVSCNKWTPDIRTIASHADILIAAAGVPGLITSEWIRPGAIVIDVGVNRVIGPDGKARTVGDVAFETARDLAAWISPVPGGVGPMTIAMLLLNVVESAERKIGLSS